LLQLKVRSVFFTRYLYQNIAEGFRDKIFDAEIVAALSGENLYLRSSAVKVFIAAMAQTEIFAEGFWDKIFDTKIVAALCSENYYLRNSTLEILTAAVACGAVHCFYWIFVLKYSQRGFGTGYLTLRSSPHLDMH